MKKKFKDRETRKDQNVKKGPRGTGKSWRNRSVPSLSRCSQRQTPARCVESTQGESVTQLVKALMEMTNP